MKKFYPGFSTLICLSFLFTLDSCTADSPYVSDETLVKVDAKNEYPYYDSRKEDLVHANSEDTYASTKRIPNAILEAYHAPDSIITYSATDADKIIDPDWKKLITRFIEGTE
ncbi:hypothetical protein [Flavobacterium psychrolimnae]|uniref:Uncharacterized protein n=1 Tax=Flavobacterium psychrolimnae TaxID=249351 RepID=A0A366B106_9FLAO|nr:hypothetical protein [Flavobacterium psychrolimnae]RBN50333.1 hypothetical protein DR980_09470 [Flavobacterium psychrolimnae]